MITIVLPISRRDYLKPVFDSLTALDKPSDTELIILIDGDKELEKAVDRRLDALSFNRIQVIKFGEGAPLDRNERRYRISEIHNKLKHCLPDEDKCEYVFAIEDDTVYSPDTLTKLARGFSNSDCAFVEGVELGRWNTPYVGAWFFDNLSDPKKVTSVRAPAYDMADPNWVIDNAHLLANDNLEEIDAGGLYCALIDADLYRMHYFEPLDKQGKNGLGCDVNFGLNLRQQDYKCYIDWSIECDHIGDKGSVNLGNTTPVQVVFTKNNKGWYGQTI